MPVTKCFQRFARMQLFKNSFVITTQKSPVPLFIHLKKQEIMASTIETGHAKNVANLSKLNQLIATLGSSYNPSNAAISATALQNLYASAGTQLTAFNTAFASWKSATNARELEFEPLAKLATQILGSLQSLSLPKQTIDDFDALVKKFRSKARKPVQNQPAAATTVQEERIAFPLPESVTVKTISTSQHSYDNKLQHFEKMLLLLQGIPSYAPNETPFKIATLQAQQLRLHTLNDAANTSYSALRLARNERNALFYGSQTGLLDLVKNAKAYIKSIYGSASPQYRAASDIKFVKVVAK